jgi:hypothetical protein
MSIVMSYPLARAAERSPSSPLRGLPLPHPQERGHDRRVLELEAFFDCKYELRGLRGLECACGFGLRGRHLIGTLSFGSPSYGPLLVQMSLPDIWYLEAVMLGLPTIRDLQATALAALLVEMATMAHETQGEDKSDDDADDDTDDDADGAARLDCHGIGQQRRRR